MVTGLITLGGMCLVMNYAANLAVKENQKTEMDFYDFFDLEKPLPKQKFQLTVINGGKTTSFKKDNAHKQIK